MIRSAFGKVALLALTTACAGVAMVGCSSDIDSTKSGKSVTDGKTGQVGLNLVPVSGVTINVVAYTVTQGVGGAVVKAGNLPVPGTGADFSFGVPLPVGTGYQLNLSAVSIDGKVTCTGGFGLFNIVANSSIDINPILTCTDITTGQPIVLVDVETTACPDITFDYVVATPKSAAIGSTISVLSNAVSASSTGLTYAWQIATPAVGTFTNPLVKDTVLTCNAAGDEVLVTVTADNGTCEKSLSTRVSCVNALCGNGLPNPGETCDEGSALNGTVGHCPADCTSQCGVAPVEGTEQCEPPNTATCNSTCQNVVPGCGDGFFTPSPTEQCDPTATPSGAPAGVTCNADCTLPPMAAVCGDGVTAASELCDPAFSVSNCGGLHPSAVAGASPACQAIESAACIACVTTAGLGSFDCASETGNAAAGPAAGQSRQSLCYKAMDCLYDTNCAAADPVNCYCGTSGAACATGGANGLCRAELEASLETTAFADVGARLGDPSFAGGTAVVRLDGARSACGVTCGTL